MKNIIKKFFAFFTIFIFLSCSAMIKKINGEHSPKIETEKSLKKFIDEANLAIDLDKNFFVKDNASKRALVNSDLVYTKNDSLIFPYGILLFNNEGTGISYLGVQKCLIDEIKTDSISELLQSSDKKFMTGVNLLELNDDFINGKGKAVSPFKLNNKPTAIIVWAKYRGRMWAGDTNSMIQNLKSSPKNYDIYFLNLDPNKYYSQFDTE